MKTWFDTPSPLPLDNLGSWMGAFLQLSVAWEALALLACWFASGRLVYALRRRFTGNDFDASRSVLFGSHDIDGVLFPVMVLCLAELARVLLARTITLALFQLVLPIFMALALIRLTVKVLQIAFNGAGWARALEHTVSWLVWLAFALWISGLLPALMNELEGVGWKVGHSTLTLRAVIEGIVTAVAVMVLTLWLSSGIEARLLRSATGGELSLRKAASNATRALLVFVGLMLSLSAIGIDLTALSVVGGAIGVGIGLGLQKLAASYISGFVILTERSIRIGDYVRVDNFEGQVRHINARFTVIRSQGGQESLVPNELLLSQRVENWSLDDRRILQTCTVVVDQAADVQQTMGLLTQVLDAQPRVLKDPAPVVLLAQVDQGGLGFTLNYWIDDLDQGQGNLKSDILVAVLASLRSQGVALAQAPAVALLTR
jgi:hypothetical protein